jgi:predicted ester cyclase
MTDAITTRNKQIIRRLYKEVLAGWNLSLIDELVADQFISHDWPEDGPRGPRPFRDFYVNIICSVLPDARYEVDDLIGEKDKVVVRWRLIGTHKGNFRGIAPTGRVITLNGVAIYRLQNGQLAERWVVTDLHGLLRELEEHSSNAQQIQYHDV